MNRNDRSKIMIRTREFLMTLQSECESYSSFLDEMASHEENKLDNVPEAFSESSLSEKLTEDIENINAANEMVQEILSTTREIPDLLNIQIRKARTVGTDRYTVSGIRSASVSLGERKTERLQLVLTPTVSKALKHESSRRKISMNELINQMLKRELPANNAT